MALLKTVPTEFGIDAAYWTILSIDHNRDQRGCHVTLAGYVGASARGEGHRPLALVQLPLTGDRYPATEAGLTYQAIYEAISMEAGQPEPQQPFHLFTGCQPG
jgi:hypothetical protein